MKLRLTFCFLILAGALSSPAQQRTAAFQLNQKLGRGINMGNCFEAPSETGWGNPWRPEYFRLLSELGFQHVRLPIRWEPASRSLSAPPYTIEAEFLNRIKQVVDTALKYKLHVIINMHHHEALMANPDGEKERFLSQWRQISTFFQSYPDSLLFEVLNEPNGALTAAKWNTFFADALSEIRQSNPTRCVLVGTAEWGGLGGLSALQLPSDEHIILTLHYYNPFHFTHQGAEWSGAEAQNWLGTQWYDTENERQTIQNEFSAVQTFSKVNHIPVHIGEFGAYNKADMQSRVRWTTYLARWFEEQGFSWAYWEFSAGFGIYDPATGQLRTPLAEALLHNPMPQPAQVVATPVYTSNFRNGNDGWFLGKQAGANGSLSNTGEKLEIAVLSGGTESWHLQLTRGNLQLQQGVMYRVSFRASAAAPRTINTYVGKSGDPWNAYSDYHRLTLETTEKIFSYIFTMPATDLSSRLVFDLGVSAVGVTLSDIRLESLTIVSSAPQQPASSPLFYPNPVKDELYIIPAESFRRVSVVSPGGAVIHSQILQPGTNRLQLKHLVPGWYVLRFENERQPAVFKLLKQ